MLDIKFIRENPDIVRNACRVKNFPDVVDELLMTDARVRELKTITQTMTAEKNKISREIPTASDKASLIQRSKEISDEIANDMAELATTEEKLNDLMHRVPQIPSADAPIGMDDTANTVVKTIGTPRKFDFTPRAQWDLLDM
ncbi:MAG: serine--tRNA ligase, partial [Alphaproteobacteria bacterium]|nr:serine--tRNA ligase [Alphaproteobacteria bacterium]